MVELADTPGNSYSSFDVRIQDNSDTWSYSAAHPDHTIVVAGPPRYYSINSKLDNFLTLGALQSFVMSSAKPWQPYQPIGQISSAFLGGKSQNQAQVSRLLINAPNLLKSLYAGLGEPPKIFNSIDSKYKVDEQASQANYAGNYWINLDNPLFHVPIGLGVLFRNKNMKGVGGFYMELAVIQSFQTQVQMGQAIILENVGLIFDRVVPVGFAGGISSMQLDSEEPKFTAAT